jgi:RHS repeat-associated protein
VTTKNASGQVVVAQRLDYYPGGEIFREATGPLLISDIKHATTFTGKELDPSGYYYYDARYYEPQMQMWLSPDPALRQYVEGRSAATVYQPKNLGLYTYAWNNPVNLRDPSGRCIEDLCIGEAAAVGAFLASPAGQRTIAVAGAALTAGVAIASGAAGRAWDGIRDLFGNSSAPPTVSPGLPPSVSTAPTAPAIPGTPATPMETPKPLEAKKQDPLAPTGSAEHTKNATPSNTQPHEDGQARKRLDRGREKGDASRAWPRQRPDKWRGPWPPPAKK